MTEPPKRGRGRPRRQGADEEILALTRELLAECGYRELSLEAIVKRTGIAKTTIYRRFPSKGALVAAAIAPPPAGLSGADSILRELTDVLGLLAEPDGDALEVIRAVVEPRRAMLVDALARERDDAEGAADMMVGALLTRLIVTREPLDITDAPRE